MDLDLLSNLLLLLILVEPFFFNYLFGGVDSQICFDLFVVNFLRMSHVKVTGKKCLKLVCCVRAVFWHVFSIRICCFTFEWFDEFHV